MLLHAPDNGLRPIRIHLRQVNPFGAALRKRGNDCSSGATAAHDPDRGPLGGSPLQLEPPDKAGAIDHIAVKRALGIAADEIDAPSCLRPPGQAIHQTGQRRLVRDRYRNAPEIADCAQRWKYGVQRTGGNVHGNQNGIDAQCAEDGPHDRGQPDLGYGIGESGEQKSIAVDAQPAHC
jgi:hypothetical protein